MNTNQTLLLQIIIISILPGLLQQLEIWNAVRKLFPFRLEQEQLIFAASSRYAISP
ncbi:hypothetical protein QMK38_02760 [Lysinibacillus fusiformis]|nr:hypothetical protein [Lysinibacillus fusiformis]